MKLLSRDEFRESVFKRDHYKCIICNEKAADAHHIIERKLYNNGGYYLNNGASLCSECHIKAEETEISVDDILLKLNLKHPILPDHLYDDQKYDKWGNPIMPNGTRLKGELFYDINVQRILTNKFHLFTHKIKYPRTLHVPFSSSIFEDDKIINSMEQFHNNKVVITEKMDGENTTIYWNGDIHARSLDYDRHPSRSFVKSLSQKIGYQLPDGWRICGENLYAKHSIYYDNLKSYFYVFSIWDDKNNCLSWDETVEYSKLLELEHVPIIYEGMYDENYVKNINLNFKIQEGYVLRKYDKFNFSEFKNYVVKYVRPNHVQTSEHWKNQKLIPNKLMFDKTEV